jgi:hypothetical protein
MKRVNATFVYFNFIDFIGVVGRKYQPRRKVMKLKLFLLLLFILQKGFCQVNVFTDVGNLLMYRPIGGDNIFDKILMRPNLGIEKTNGLKTTSLLFMYKKNHGFGIFYNIFDSEGFRVDFSRKKYFPRNQRLFWETQLRFEIVNAKNASTMHWFPEVDINSKDIQLGFKIGGRGKYIRKINGDFCIGMGVGFMKNRQFVSALKDFGQAQNPTLLEYQERINSINKDINLFYVPYLQYRLHFNGKNHKKFKVYQSKVN